MKVRLLSLSLLISAPLVGTGAPSSAPAGTAPAPFAPIRPAPGKGQNIPPAPARPGQAPNAGQQANQQMLLETNGSLSVPRNGTGTNALLAFTNQFGVGTNQFGAFTNQFGVFTNPFAQFGGSNAFGFPLSNQFGTNLFVQDQALTPQDRILLARIRTALLPAIRRGRALIHLTGQNGTITIMGFVPSLVEGQQLAGIVQQTPGVASVVNQLQVAPGMVGRERGMEDQAFTGPDRELLEHIRGGIGRGERRGGVSESVRIIARNGVVTLTGFVGSEAERQALVTAARTTPGVVRVDDDLQVQTQTAPGATMGGANSPFGISTGAISGGVAIPFSVPDQIGASVTNTNSSVPFRP